MIDSIILNYEEGKVEPPELTLTEKFSQLHQLEELRIYSAQIEKFPDSITNLKKLTTLVLTGKDGDIYRYRGFTGHYLNQLPDNIGNLTNLHYVDFSRHNLTYLPDGFGNLTNLDYLDLYHNSLTSLPESFKNLRHLKTLYLNNQIPYYKKNKSSQEKFNSFPDVLCELNSLEKLDLSQNFIRTLPDSIKNLQNLTTLNMGDNKLNFLPEGVYNLENLRSLSVMHNRLKEIPKTIENLTSLEVFDISANRSLKILPDSIIKLKNIKKLYLQGTGITELPGEIFELPDITLGLTRNQAQTFSKSLENRVNITLILYKNSYSWKEDTNYYRKHPRGLFN